jgi:hypothetical protein
MIFIRTDKETHVVVIKDQTSCRIRKAMEGGKDGVRGRFCQHVSLPLGLQETGPGRGALASLHSPDVGSESENRRTCLVYMQDVVDLALLSFLLCRRALCTS